MAQIVTCPSCQHKISSEARSCPQCGGPGSQEVQGGRLALGHVIVVLLLVLFIVFGLSSLGL